MTITITHPGARLLAPTLDVLADVVAGDWTTAARLCATRLEDPAACAAELDALAVRAGAARHARQPYHYRVFHRMLLVDEHPALLGAALDLHVNLMLGRWEALEKVTPPCSRPAAGWRTLELVEARIRHQRPGAWSEDPCESGTLTAAPPTVRLAHRVLTEIEGGIRYRYDLPAGAPAVHVG